jgi:hypothetical protein
VDFSVAFATEKDGGRENDAPIALRYLSPSHFCKQK